MQKFLKNLLLGFVLWSAYNFLNAGVLAIQQNMAYGQAWISTAMSTYSMAVLSIALWFFCKQIPFKKPKIVQFVAAHLAGSILFSASWVGACYLMHLLFVPAAVHKYLLSIGIYLWQFLDGITKYGFLAGIFYTIDFYKKFKEKELRESELGLLTKKMELQNLKSQLNPHFLFNALNSVNALMAKDPEKARTMNSKLAQLLRFSLDGYDKRFVTLKEEIEFIHNYLDIEKVRFGDKLKVHEKIDTALLDTKIPSMLLQPLVENAIKHGISREAKGGELTIQILRNNGFLNLEISNTGEPVPEETLAAILNKGIGLKNTNERLKRIYGESCSLELHSTPPNRFSVSIKIPHSQL